MDKVNQNILLAIIALVLFIAFFGFVYWICDRIYTEDLLKSLETPIDTILPEKSLTGDSVGPQVALTPTEKSEITDLVGKANYTQTYPKECSLGVPNAKCLEQSEKEKLVQYWDKVLGNKPITGIKGDIIERLNNQLSILTK